MLFFETTSFFMDFFNNLYSETPQSVIFRSELLNAIPTFVTGLLLNANLLKALYTYWVFSLCCHILYI